MSEQHYDPIAEKLHQSDEKIYNDPLLYTKIKHRQRELFVENKANDSARPNNDTQQARNDAWAATHPLAQYETYEYLDDQSPEVLAFVKSLGYDPITLQSIDIHIEAGQPVVCVAKTMPLASKTPRIGATLKTDNKVCTCGCGHLIR